jgi:hypothetical protein
MLVLQYMDPDNADCAHGLPSLIYCAGEGVDARPCCAAAGVSAQCQSLCNSQEVSVYTVYFCHTHTYTRTHIHTRSSSNTLTQHLSL